MENLVIIGAGGFGREVAALVQDINNCTGEKWNFLGFIDDEKTGSTVEGYPILGDRNYLFSMREKPCVAIAIANSPIREKLVYECREHGLRFPSLIHPSVSIGPNVSFGEGCIICRGGIYTTNIKIGDFCILNLNVTFGHDTVVEDFVSIMSHTAIAGEVRIGKGCYFGLHCTVINLVTIAAGCTFGAGCTVVHDIAQSGTYVGVPAKKIK